MIIIAIVREGGMILVDKPLWAVNDKTPKVYKQTRFATTLWELSTRDPSRNNPTYEPPLTLPRA